MPTTKYDAKYGGFWNRFVACLIDLVLIGVIIFIVVDVIYHVLGGSDIVAGGTIENVLSFLFLILDWLYFAIMESSAKQGTLGKMAVGLVVTDKRGKRLTFGRATGRYFAKWISGKILIIGYIMAAFTEKKQALHDIIAGTMMVYQRGHG